MLQKFETWKIHRHSYKRMLSNNYGKPLQSAALISTGDSEQNTAQTVRVPNLGRGKKYSFSPNSHTSFAIHTASHSIGKGVVPPVGKNSRGLRVTTHFHTMRRFKWVKPRPFPSGFGDLEVACWPLVPKFAGSHPAEFVVFLGRKNPQHAFLRRGSKVGLIS
jgi:hypothetical protein